ncbi:hypothetical protein NITLEN_150005 [Nitrospira lenta]|uniref:Uncharacterized protein n=1 Tax=Nitrospira lenta TaxID=1436998 RepID=A0A330L3G1_9BACT|nr:hypothetical protein NITLEN_150005 [Nitrospira lenta]
MLKYYILDMRMAPPKKNTPKLFGGSYDNTG